MGGLLFLLSIVAAGPIDGDEIAYQDAVFQQWWHADFHWKFEDLPTASRVAPSRVPYSGYIYPDYRGGTSQTLRKYDQAFHGTELLATSYEQRDIATAGGTTSGRSVRNRPIRGNAIPHWHGHCNGWTAAAIRHAEPRHNVVRNGVVFTPQDIKALLAEIYVYNDPQMLNSDDATINPGLLHAIIANWLGRGLHPIAMESDPGPMKWNYPIYAFSTSSRELAGQVEVKMLIAYSNNSDREQARSPRIQRIKRFHYMLDLNEDGEIVGGSYTRDSSRIQSLWVPLQPQPAGSDANQRGNPHVDVPEVLSIWRESVPADVRNEWAVIDPITDQEAVRVPTESNELVVPSADD